MGEIVDIPLSECEFCHARVREETKVSLGDVSVCQKCAGEWQAEYDACEHEWEADHYYGRICRKCNGTDYRNQDDTDS